MTKIVKILGNIILATVELVLLLLVVLAFLVRTAEFQTYAAQKGSVYLSSYLDAEVSIGKVDAVFFDRIYIDEIYLEDQRQDTLGYVKELFLNISIIELAQNEFTLDKVGIDRAIFNLKKMEGSDDSNLQFLLDVFKSDEASTPPDFSLLVSSLSVTNSEFLFHDENVPTNPFGVDFKHLGLKKLNLSASKIEINQTDYSATIDQLSFRDRSGFNLNELSTNAVFSQKGLDLKNTTINTALTSIDLPTFSLRTEDFKSYQSFVDEVPMLMDIQNASVSMADVSMFAPALEGMDAIVNLSGKTSKPVNGLLIEELDLKMGDGTHITGDFILPDFSDTSELYINQTIDHLTVYSSDIARLRLPKQSSTSYLELPNEVHNLVYLSGDNIIADGYLNDLDLTLGALTTGAGNLAFNGKVKVKNIANNEVLTLNSELPKSRFLTLEKFNLGQVIDNKDFKNISGNIGFSLELLADEYFKLNNLRGHIKRFEAFEYPYRNILLSKVDLGVDLSKKITETTLNGLLYARDENLDLVYEGKAIFGEVVDLDIDIAIECAHLEKIHASFKNRGELIAQFHLKGKGTTIDSFSGSTVIDSLYYEEEGNAFDLAHFDATLIRASGKDDLTIRSPVLDADMEGYADLDYVLDNAMYQASQVFPALFPELEPVFDENSEFSYKFNIKQMNPIFEIFIPELKVADNTVFSGFYKGAQNDFELDLFSDYVQYNDFRFEEITIFQELKNNELLALYMIDRFYVKDSLVLKDMHSTNIAANGFMDSQLIFHDRFNSRSNLEWYTHIFEVDGFDIDILPSYFTLNNHRWDLKEQAHLNYSTNCFLIEDFLLTRKEQFIEIKGQVSKLPEDRLNIDVRNFDLSDVAVLLAPDNTITGRANISGQIQEALTDLKFSGITDIKNLVIDNREIGDVSFQADYDADKKSINMLGDLFYANKRTFKFKGDYFLDQPENSLDFQMDFNNADIAVLNSFMDPDVVRGLSGKLRGSFDLTGSIKNPVLEGAINLDDGKATLALLGAEFKYYGKVEADQYGIYLNAMPIEDEEGNTGFLAGHIFHDNFSDMMFEFNFNFKEHPSKRNPLNPSEALKLDRFLVMKTKYSEESLYYGNAYMTGSASVSGTPDDLSVRVDAETRKGTWINFPMYGPTTIEEDGFIKFKTADVPDSLLEEQGIDFTGVDLSLNFKVTPDARVKLIFDDNLGDEITAKGSGDLTIDLDQYGDIALNGTYTVSEGDYNFVMGPYKQKFFISEGGTVQWTGSPYSAKLDIETYYTTNANLAVVMTDIIENRVTDNEVIYSYLKLRGDMNKPEISFDLAAPNATEAGKTVMNRIRSDKDELNRQFFSILIWKRFQPLAGQEGREAGASGGAALDLVSTQINSLLSKVSDDYKMNFALDNDEMTGEGSVEFGVKKEFLDDRLIVSGSFGVGNYNQTNADQNNLIHEFNLEYLLNDKGTFRINVFNQSNANRIVNQNAGLFTQGVGINYREDFHNFRDFKAFLFFSSLLSGEDMSDYQLNNQRYEPIPKEYLDKNEQEAKEEEETEVEENNNE